MKKLIIQESKSENKKQIALIEDEKLVEFYIEDEDTERHEGNIYIGIVRDIIKGMQAAFINIGTEKNSFIHLKDVLPKVDETKVKQDENIAIKTLLKPNQKVLVQVKRDSNDKKGARVSTHINLPGKYIALMPNTDIVTVSQKIEDKNEQQRLIKLVKENLSKGNGAIIRTSAEHKDKEIIEDIKKVENKWKRIVSTNINPNENEPKLLYKSDDIIEKMLVDLSDKEFNEIEVNTKEQYQQLKELKEENKEYSNIKITLKEQEVIFDGDIEKQIKKSVQRKVWLKCGGFIAIDKTEALTSIDVNTGKFTGTTNLEETVYKVNTEATIEIAKQLRLRDIGGIIIVDYIDMKSKEKKQNIENLLKEELKKDRSKTQVEGYTKLDLMELTRKHICSHKE